MVNHDKLTTNSISDIKTVLLIALIVRVLYLVIYSGMPEWTQLTVDNYYHIHWAERIAGGELFGDTTYFRAPFYVFVLALLIKIFSASLWLFRIFGVFVGLMSVSFVYLIAKRLFSKKAALVSSLIYALSPLTIYFESEILLDSLFTLFILAFIHLLLKAVERQELYQYFMAGIFWGLAVITRPTALVLVPVVIWFLISNKKNFTSSVVRTGAALFIGLSLIVGTVFVRNIVVADDPVLVASQGGINFYIGNNYKADGLTAQLPEPLGFNWRMKDVAAIAEHESGRQLKPGEISSFWTMKTVEWIKNNPTDFLTLYLKKISYALSFKEISNNRNLPIFFGKHPILSYNIFGFWFFFVTFMLGISLLKKFGSKEKFLIYSLTLYLLAMALFFITSRFRLPLMAIMVLFSGYGILNFKELLSQPRQIFKSSSYLAAAVGLGFVSFIYLPSVAPAMNFNSIGLYHYSEMEYETALENFRTGLSFDNSMPELNLNIAASFVKMGELDSATLYLMKEIRLHPERPKGYADLASIKMLEGMSSVSVNLAKKGLAVRPYDPFVNKVLIRVLEADSLTMNKELIDEATAGINRTDYNLDYLVDAGLTLLSAGLYDAAEELFISALYAPPPPVETDDACFDRIYVNSTASRKLLTAKAAYRLSYIYGSSGNLNSAVNSAQQAIEMDPNLTEAYVNLIGGLRAQQKYNSADSLLKIADQLFPTDTLIKRLH